MTADRERTATIPPRRSSVPPGCCTAPSIGSAGGGSASARPKAGAKFGMLRLMTVGDGRASHGSRSSATYEDGPNLVTLAMNGWADAEPAWWLNLQAHPDTVVEMKDGPRAVRGRAAEGEERDRLWARWGEFSDQYDGWAAMRSGQTAVVVLEPRTAG